MTQRPATIGGSGGRPIRVLFVNDHLGGPDGVTHGGTTYLTNVLPSFDRDRVETSLAVLRAYHPAAERLRALGVPVRFFGRGKWDPRALHDIEALIRASDPDIVQTNGKKSHLLGRLAAVRTGRPSILHLHFEYRPRPEALNAWLAPRTAVAIGVSERLRNHAETAFGMDPTRCRAIYHGVDVGRFIRPPEEGRERVRRELLLDDSRPVLVVPGRLSIDPDKGQRTAIRAVASLRARIPGVVLLLAGEGPARAACEALIAELGVEAEVRLLGQRQDLPSVLAAADLVMVPSDCRDAFPFTAVEGMCAGKPIVASRDGGLEEMLDGGRRGVLVPAGDHEAFAGACEDLLRRPDLARRLADEGAAFARTLTIPKHIGELADLYAEVLGRG